MIESSWNIHQLKRLHRLACDRSIVAPWHLCTPIVWFVRLSTAHDHTMLELDTFHCNHEIYPSDPITAHTITANDSDYLTCCPNYLYLGHTYTSVGIQSVLRYNWQTHVASASPDTIDHISTDPHSCLCRIVHAVDCQPIGNSNRQSKKCDWNIEKNWFPFVLCVHLSVHSLVFIYRTSNNSIFELHSAYNFIMIIFSAIDFIHVGGQMWIYKTNKCLVQLQTYANATFITLNRWQEKNWWASKRIISINQPTQKLSAPVPTLCVE